MKEKIKFIDGLKKYVKLTKFLPEKCGMPLTSTVRHKINGKNSAGKALSFSDEEMHTIVVALNKWAFEQGKKGFIIK